jgi:hypothetical protein
LPPTDYILKETKGLCIEKRRKKKESSQNRGTITGSAARTPNSQHNVSCTYESPVTIPS